MNNKLREAILKEVDTMTEKQQETTLKIIQQLVKGWMEGQEHGR